MHSQRRVRFENRYDDRSLPRRSVTLDHLTLELRNCYETVDKGRKLLERLYSNLQRPFFGKESQRSHQSDFQLTIELENLKDVLELIAKKRSHYIEEISKAQFIVGHDRQQMEEFLRMVKTTDNRLREKLKSFNQFSQQPKNLVTELEENNEILGELLREIKEQLIAEERFIMRQSAWSCDDSSGTEASFTGSPRDRLSYIRGRRRGRAREITRVISSLPDDTNINKFRERPEKRFDGYANEWRRSKLEKYSNQHRESPCQDNGDRDGNILRGLERTSLSWKDIPHSKYKERLGDKQRKDEYRVERWDKEENNTDDCDTSSLSLRLKQLVRQSDNVQKLISNVGRKDVGEMRKDKSLPVPISTTLFGKSSAGHPSVANKRDVDASLKYGFSNKQDVDFGKHEAGFSHDFEVEVERDATSKGKTLTPVGSGRSSEDIQIVLDKCDELQISLRACSPREVRERLIQNLKQVEKADKDADEHNYEDVSLTRQTLRKKSDANHEKIRKDFISCLDKIFEMEKSYGSAEDEIKSLRHDLEKALVDRDAAVRVMKSENEELNMRLDIKSKDMETCDKRLKQTEKSLQELKVTYEMERDAEKQFKITDRSKQQGLKREDLKSLIEECEKLKSKVDDKGKEVDKLRKELHDAIEEIQKIKNVKTAAPLIETAELSPEEVQKYELKIHILQEEVNRLKAHSAEDIAAELAALQKIIDVAEKKQEKISQENVMILEENSLLAAEKIQLANYVEELNDRLEKHERTEGLQEKFDELQLLSVAKDAEIEYLKKNNLLVLDNPINEQYEVDLKVLEDECNSLKKKLKNYEDLLGQDGGEINKKLDEMYQECVKSVENVNRKKEKIEEEFQKQKEIYEDLLAECHNEINLLQRKAEKSVVSGRQFDKREVLEAFLNSERSTDELAALLGGDFVDSDPKEESYIDVDRLVAENEDLRRKMSQLDKNVAGYQSEASILKKKNRELKEKIELVKSENYIMNKMRDDEIVRFKELSEEKDKECKELRKSLCETVGYDEKEELLGRLRDIHRELMQTEEEKGGISLIHSNFAKTREALEKKDKDIANLKRQNRLLADMIGLEEPFRRMVINKLASNDSNLEDLVSNLAKGSSAAKEITRAKCLEELNEKLESRIIKLNKEIMGFSEVKEELKDKSQRLKQVDDQCQLLEDENFSLRERLRSLQNEVKELSLATRNRKAGKDKAHEELLNENEALNERVLLKELEVERLSENVDELKMGIKKSEKETADLKESVDGMIRSGARIEKLQEDNVEKDEKIKELKKALLNVEKERKEINADFVRLKIKGEEDAKLFSNEMKKLHVEIENLILSRQGTPVERPDGSYESLPMDDKDGGSSRYDRSKLIKKLQTENHQLASKLLCLEDETTAITKIVADMERGHGHLTGILRGHLILQKDSTAKLLESSLHQYADEYEAGKRNFQAIENRFDKDKQHTTRRGFAWDFFANATATINNITAILDEGLIKVEDDLERDFTSDQDFEEKDYKSRVWILRRRLSNVEKRYRDLMLRAEELSVRLDAKTTEYDVTQDELEDVTRVLEVNEMTMGRIREELAEYLRENNKLKGIMKQLRDHQESTVGAVMAENDMLKKEIEDVSENRGAVKSLELEMENLRDRSKADEDEVKGLRKTLHEQEKREKENVDRVKIKLVEEVRKGEEGLNQLSKELSASERKFEDSNSKIKELEELVRKLEEKNATLEKYLQKSRAGCRSEGIDHHGTIHMLRDDLKKLFKENEELKQEIHEKHRKITALAKDLREAKIAVKEQLGTERSVDEKLLDRAAKDQIMALKRRIRVLEMDKEKLEKSASITERNQRLSEESLKNKKDIRPKSRSGEKDISSSKSLTEGDRFDSFKSDTSKGDDTSKSISILDEDPASFAEGDTSLASIESIKNLNDDVKREIELRDNLIQELESRIRELKQELSLKSGEERRLPNNKELRGDGGMKLFTFDENSMAQSDFQSVARENTNLKWKLREQENGPIDVKVKQRDDIIEKQRNKLSSLENEIEGMDDRNLKLQNEIGEMKNTVPEDWKCKEYVLLEVNAKDSKTDISNKIEMLNNEISGLKRRCISKERIIEDLKSEQRELESSSTGEVTRVDEAVAEATSASNVETVFDFAISENIGGADSSARRIPKFISIKKEDEAGRKKSVGRGKSPSRIPISPRPKSLSLQMPNSDSQGSETKTVDELEKKIKDQEEDIKTLLQSVEYFENEVENMTNEIKEVDNLKAKAKKAEIEAKALKVKNSKIQEQLKDSKVYDDRLKELENKMKKLIVENKSLERQMKDGRRRHSDAGEKSKQLLDASKMKLLNLQDKVGQTEQKLEVKEKQLKVVRRELEIKSTFPSEDDESLKTVIRESIENKIVTSAMKNDTEEEIEKLRKGKVGLENDLNQKTRMLDEKVEQILTLKENILVSSRDFETASEKIHDLCDEIAKNETELKRLRARNIALEATQDAVRELSVRPGGLRISFDEESVKRDVFTEFGNHLKDIKIVWDQLKDELNGIGINTSRVNVVGEQRDLMGNDNSEEIRQIVREMEEVCMLVGEASKKNDENFGADLKAQKIVNTELENKINEYKKVVEETSLRILELENEVSEKEHSDEIGHKLLLDKSEDLRNKLQRSETEKKHLNLELERHEKNLNRLTGQVKILEKEVIARETEISELTQRALDSEEDSEIMKSRVEELEDDYNRLLQFGMRVEGDENCAEDNEKRDQVLNIQKLETEKFELEKGKAELEDKINDLSKEGKERLLEKEMLNEALAETKEECVRLEEAVSKLEFNKADLQERMDEMLSGQRNINDEMFEQLQENEKKILGLEDAMFRVELEKASLQTRLNDMNKGDGGSLNKMLFEKENKIAELKEENSKMEDEVYRLDLDKNELQKRIDELTSSEIREDYTELKRMLIEWEEKVADLEIEKSILFSQREELQKAIDEILESPRSSLDEEMSDDERKIFKGGPKEWKRRLIAAYRDIRDKSFEIVTLKMILESKNVEIGLLNNAERADKKDVSFDSIDGNDKDRKSIQLKNTVYMLQEEVRIKTKEICELRDETSNLENSLQSKKELGSNKVALRINGKNECEIENEQLQQELHELKIELREKEENYDSLCDQLFGGEQLATVVENSQLKNEIADIKNELACVKNELAEKGKPHEELEENYELIYNELTRMKAGIDTDDTPESDLQLETLKRQSKVDQLEKALLDYEERYRLISKDFDEVEERYRDELNYASTHIGQLMLQVGELEEKLRVTREQQSMPQGEGESQSGFVDQSELQVMEERLKYAREDVSKKNELIHNLKETLASFYAGSDDHTESLSNELKRLLQENGNLQDQLDLQRQRYELEVDSMRTSMSALKHEHVQSLKDDFERVCKDKIELQVKFAELQEKVTKQQDTIEELTAKNIQFREKHDTAEQGDVLDLSDITA